MAGCCLPACSRIDRRDPLTIGGESVPTFRSDATPMAERGPSLLAGSRDHWEPETILVPIDDSVHYPTFTLGAPNYGDSRRARGGYPDAESALDTNEGSSAQVWEGAAAPFHAGTDILLFIPRAFATAPWTSRGEQGAAFERSPDSAGSIAPALSPEPAPIAASR